MSAEEIEEKGAEGLLAGCHGVLVPGGSFVAKVFHGEGFDDLVREARAAFDKVLTRKPAASRPRSREVYLVARGYRGTGSPSP